VNSPPTFSSQSVSKILSYSKQKRSATSSPQNDASGALINSDTFSRDRSDSLPPTVTRKQKLDKILASVKLKLKTILDKDQDGRVTFSDFCTCIRGDIRLLACFGDPYECTSPSKKPVKRKLSGHIPLFGIKDFEHSLSLPLSSHKDSTSTTSFTRLSSQQNLSQFRSQNLSGPIEQNNTSQNISNNKNNNNSNTIESQTSTNTTNRIICYLNCLVVILIFMLILGVLFVLNYYFGFLGFR